MLPTFFFFNDTATTEIYTLSLHDALPICACFGACFLAQSAVLSLSSSAGLSFVADGSADLGELAAGDHEQFGDAVQAQGDRKSTRLNSSPLVIPYAVFCLEKTTN